MSDSPPTAWVIHAGRRGRDASAFEEAGIVALSLPPIAGLPAMTRDEAMTAIETALSEEGDSVRSARNLTFAQILWRFIHEIRIGDRVLTADSAASQVLGGVISGGYTMTTTPVVPGYHHIRSVAWIGSVPRSELPRQVLRSIGAPSPMYVPATQVQIATLPLWDAAETRS